MKERQRYWPEVALFASGLAGLIYEVVWIRQLILVFGSTTRSMVAVVAAFMAGLALGSWLGGRVADRVKWRLKWYGLLEMGVGVWAGMTLYLMGAIGEVYRRWAAAYPDQGLGGWGLRLGLAVAVLLPATTAMGGTLPVMAKWVAGWGGDVAKKVARLYAANTWGAFWGVMLGSWVLIEVLGLRGSIKLAAVLSGGVGVASWYAAGRAGEGKGGEETKNTNGVEGGKWGGVAVGVFGMSGMIALAYQVLWTRMLVPSTGTFVYAFATILGLYLLGIVLGSYWYEKLVEKELPWRLVLGTVEVGIGICAMGSIVVNSELGGLEGWMRLGLTVLPATVLMGVSFPVVVKIIASYKKMGEQVGMAYAVNTVGAIVGAVAAAFVIIPTWGVARGIAVLALGNVGLGGVMWMGREKKGAGFYRRLLKAGLIVGVVGGVGLVGREGVGLMEVKARRLVESLQPAEKYRVMYLEDEVASVLGFEEKGGKVRELIIDGVPTTRISAETSLLAHVPMMLHRRPERALVVALGMGNTFRSALMYEETRVDVVELVPAVVEMLPLYHAEGWEGMEKNIRERGRIIVNDGRNYVRMTEEKYDVVMVDPPPPVNASGTTVLYARDFYEDLKKVLNPGGIVAAWFYRETKVDDFRMLWKSFREAFDHVLVLRSPNELGYYLVGTKEKMEWVLNRERWGEGEKLLADINRDGTEEEGERKVTWEVIEEMYIGDEKLVDKFTKGAVAVTDDFPRTEYFLMRRIFNLEPTMSDEWLGVEK